MNILNNTTFDQPVKYKNLTVYPVTVKDIIAFNTYSQCLVVDKNSIPDVKIISMTELEYLYHTASKNEENTPPYLVWLDRLLALCLKEDDSFSDILNSLKRYKIDENGRPFFIIGEQKYDSEDYDNLKLIIAEQNVVELIDENISKEVRDSLEAAREFKRKISGEKVGTTEDYIVSLAISTGWTLEYIHGLSIRKFIKSIRRMDTLIHYKIFQTASLSGMVTFKDRSFIKHWLSDLEEEDKYADVSINMNDMENKLSFESAKA